MSGSKVSTRTELLFKPGSDELSPLGQIVLYGVPHRDFPNDNHGLRLWRLQDWFYALLNLYKTCDSADPFRRFVGSNVQSLDHALRRCSWLIPRVDRQLANAQLDPDAGKCRDCPWITGRFDERDCPGKSCPAVA